MDVAACNYDMDATDDDSSHHAETYYDCDGNCLMDMDGDGVCDELEVEGWTKRHATTMMRPTTTVPVISQQLAMTAMAIAWPIAMEMASAIHLRLRVARTLWPAITTPQRRMTTACASTRRNTTIATATASTTLTAMVSARIEIAGCTNETACNYDAAATDDDGMCEYAEEYYDCDGNCLNDADGDGVCDELEIAGCTDEWL